MADANAWLYASPLEAAFAAQLAQFMVDPALKDVGQSGVGEGPPSDTITYRTSRDGAHQLDYILSIKNFSAVGVDLQAAGAILPLVDCLDHLPHAVVVRICVRPKAYSSSIRVAQHCLADIAGRANDLNVASAAIPVPPACLIARLGCTLPTSAS